MTFKTFIGATTLALALTVQAGFAYAAEPETLPVSETVVVTTETAPVATITASSTDPIVLATEELASLKLREQDPQTGSFTKFLLRFKIRQLENQLNIKKALK
jgi:hypothetical protein